MDALDALSAALALLAAALSVRRTLAHEDQQQRRASSVVEEHRRRSSAYDVERLTSRRWSTASTASNTGTGSSGAGGSGSAHSTSSPGAPSDSTPLLNASAPPRRSSRASARAAPVTQVLSASIGPALDVGAGLLFAASCAGCVFARASITTTTTTSSSQEALQPIPWIPLSAWIALVTLGSAAFVWRQLAIGNRWIWLGMVGGAMCGFGLAMAQGVGDFGGVPDWVLFGIGADALEHALRGFVREPVREGVVFLEKGFA